LTRTKNLQFYDKKSASVRQPSKQTAPVLARSPEKKEKASRLDLMSFSPVQLIIMSHDSISGKHNETFQEEFARVSDYNNFLFDLLN